MICLSVVSHGQVTIATGLLQAIARLRPSLVSRIIYTRNVPEPDLPALELGHIELVVITNRRAKGFGENHNFAFQHCTQPFFCVVNPDIQLTSDPFPALIEAFGDEGLGLVAPLVTTPDDQVENTSRALYTPRELILQKLRPDNRAAAAAWLAGMFMLFRSEAYRGVSGFDCGYFLYIEDVDICTRMRVAGWRLRQVPDARVIHEAQKRSHRSLHYTRWHLAGMLRYWRSPSFWLYRRLLREERRKMPSGSVP
jgi:N-acetylglucosaminyl-diphospho-decaprenol L-rhamnosyltransferase